jgi:hypothetical protein
MKGQPKEAVARVVRQAAVGDAVFQGIKVLAESGDV